VRLTASRYQLWYGRDEPPIVPRFVRAGPLEVELHGADVRYVRSGCNEVVRRVYMAVRDLNWNTLPLELGDMVIEESADAFKARFHARNRSGEIDFSWVGRIEGTPDGIVSYELDGVAETSFSCAKIGLCLHHPIHETAGRLFRGEGRTAVGGELPRLIGPQINLPDAGWDLPLFEPVSWLEIDLPHDERLRCDFEGDLFEMEDQRNWSDGSFKTSSTPASLGYRHTIERGDRVQQRVTFRVARSRRAPARRRSNEATTLRIGEPIGLQVPPIGLGVANHGETFTDHEAELLRGLAPAHLRHDVYSTGDARSSLRQALLQCGVLNCALELALFVDVSETAEVLDEIRLSSIPVARVLVFDRHAEATAPDRVVHVREQVLAALGNVPVGGGTNVYFNELNRNRPDPDGLDVVCFSINPQLHAFDELSLVESLEAQAEIVRSSRVLSDGVAVAVTPVTLKPRFNAVAKVPEDALSELGLPRQVDARQMSLFGAAWTLGSVKYLTESGAASITYFETTGQLGVLERGSGSPNPNAFPSFPGQAFPLYHVLADAVELRGAQVLECSSTAPLNAIGMALRRNGVTTLLVANLTPTRRRVEVIGLDGEARVRRLEARTAVEAGSDPGGFRTRRERMPDSAVLTLSPFETLSVEVR
jgi:D-apionolactonase